MQAPTTISPIGAPQASAKPASSATQKVEGEEDFETAFDAQAAPEAENQMAEGTPIVEGPTVDVPDITKDLADTPVAEAEDLPDTGAVDVPEAEVALPTQAAVADAPSAARPTPGEFNRPAQVAAVETQDQTIAQRPKLVEEQVETVRQVARLTDAPLQPGQKPTAAAATPTMVADPKRQFTLITKDETSVAPDKFELRWPTDPKTLTPAQSHLPQMRVQAQVNMAKIATPTIVPTQITTATDEAQKALDLVGQFDDLSLDQPRARQEAPATNLGTLVAAHTRSDMTANIARQIATLMQRSSGQSIELSLSPAELGQVRLKMTPAESGLVVSVVAERPETLDLMRRNIDALERAMNDIGYSDVAFSFDMGSETFGDTQDEGSTASESLSVLTMPEGAEAEDAMPTPLQVALNGLDVRV